MDILKCLTSLNLDWYKSYGTKWKKTNKKGKKAKKNFYKIAKTETKILNKLKSRIVKHLKMTG